MLPVVAPFTFLIPISLVFFEMLICEIQKSPIIERIVASNEN